jgi:predicted homoserine dehydrogenase-like protein
MIVIVCSSGGVDARTSSQEKRVMLERLRGLEEPITVAIVGMGAMGKGLFYQCCITPGFRCVAVADLKLQVAIAFVQSMGKPYEVVETLDAAHDCIARGHVAIAQDGELLARLEGVDAFIESTSAIAEAARFAVTALQHEKHLILMNAEIDSIFGPYLMQLAHEKGLVCASCDGDQHGVIKRVIDEMELWGFQPVMAGNIKGFLDRYSNPIKIRPEADKRKLDYKMCTAYTDGTKLNVEMSLVANALGCCTDVVGMHGPKAKHVDEVLALFDFDQMRDRTHGQPVVDYILGALPGGGIYAVGYCSHPYQMDMLQYYKMGNGPYYLFYRPYHLCHVEALRGVAEAVLDGVSLLEPSAGFRTNVIAYAKCDLKQGEVLDGIGGHCCYGLIENCRPDGSIDGLPICLAEEVRLARDIRKDERIRMADVIVPAARFDYDLYARAVKSKSTIAVA